MKKKITSPRWLALACVILLALGGAAFAANTLGVFIGQDPNFTGELSGPSADVTTLKLAGTAITSTASELNKLHGVTATYAELNAVAGVTAGTVAAGKAVVVDSNKDVGNFRYLTATNLKTDGNVGAAATGVTAVEYGDGYNHVTVLTVDTTLPAITGGVNQGLGKLLYTLPAGACIVSSARMNLAITQSEGNITADTPDGGLGTTIASGAVATLDGTPAFENILTGQAFDDCNGTAEDKTLVPTAAVPLVIESGGDHTIYFNVADGWAASGDTAAGLAGTVVVVWTFLGS